MVPETQDSTNEDAPTSSAPTEHEHEYRHDPVYDDNFDWVILGMCYAAVAVYAGVRLFLTG